MARAPEDAPLADRMRPTSLAGFAGQAHLIAAGKPLRQAIDSGRLHSMIFWGPPGTGKTTLARLVSGQSGAHFLTLSAVLAGVKEIREAVAQAKAIRAMDGKGTVLFIDEVHRFNKSQQDAFLPHVENGTLTFIGATTENPSFSLNNALLSRARVYVLQSLTEDDLVQVLTRALADSQLGLGAQGLTLAEEAVRLLAKAADGDARRALNLLELAAQIAIDGRIEVSVVAEVSAASVRRFDKGGDIFYDQISALHKSIRGSSPDGALYWLARMIDAGCDPLYIARRLVRMASEDIGNADPRALDLAMNAWQAQERLGSPEGELALAQAAVYMACAAKSNAVYTAWNAALADARSSGSLDVPVHLRNAPTKLMKALGHGRAYRYAHDEPEAYAAGERYLPDALGERRYYAPVDRGLEIRIREKLAHLAALDQAAGKTEPQ
ncbi:replication-associated recombination protein A [Thiocystis violacea]|uniref:replication-associated recombination protein A n=1 Tax=Thiocystis violacea TaxID=13725 RepID=UPI0019071585|nr:replication-associated recombination protein A [Thiocystis violacea]MBK1725143.1 recombination factor protein RarA [Thiocystis violacea]